jgi:pimeloyl-ACP methyl ester carboxylesterase
MLADVSVQAEPPDTDPAPAPATAHPETSFVRAGGVALALRRFSAGAPDVVLLHGLASNARIWDGVGSLLAARGIAALAVDLRGHGESDRPTRGYNLPTSVADLDAVLGAIGAARPVVVGHSFGAHVALQHAVDGRHPTGGLIGVDGGFLDWRVTPGLTADLARARLAPSEWEMPLAEWRRARWLPDEVDRAAPWVQAFLDASVLVGLDGHVRPRLPTVAHAALAGEIVRQHPAALVSRLSVPYQLCLAARDDLPIPKAPGFAELGERFAAGRYCIHPNAPHDLPLVQPGRLADEIAAFLGATSAARPPQLLH